MSYTYSITSHRLRGKGVQSHPDSTVVEDIRPSIMQHAERRRVTASHQCQESFVGRALRAAITNVHASVAIRSVSHYYLGQQIADVTRRTARVDGGRSA